MGMNAIYHLPTLNLVFRVHHPSKSHQDVQLEVDTANYLNKQQFNSISISDAYSDIYQYQDIYLTVWNYLAGEKRPLDLASEFGKLIKQFHKVMSLPGFQDCYHSGLSEFNPLQLIHQRINLLHTLPSIDDSILHILNSEYHDLLGQADNIDFLFPKGPIHGDAHTANVIWSKGEMFLLDYENISYGYRDNDLIPFCVIAKRFKPETKVEKFLQSYQPGLSLAAIDNRLIRIRELFMLSWLCQSIGKNETSDKEIKHRLHTVQAKEDEVLWHPM